MVKSALSLEVKKPALNPGHIDSCERPLSYLLLFWSLNWMALQSQCGRCRSSSSLLFLKSMPLPGDRGSSLRGSFLQSEPSLSLPSTETEARGVGLEDSPPRACASPWVPRHPRPGLHQDNDRWTQSQPFLCVFLYLFKIWKIIAVLLIDWLAEHVEDLTSSTGDGTHDPCNRSVKS